MTYQPNLSIAGIEPQHYSCAIHESGHTVAAYALGFGMRKKGMVLCDSIVEGLVDGVACTHIPGRRSHNLKRREFFLKRDIVIAFAGPIAERMVHAIQDIDQDVMRIGWALTEPVPSQKQLFVGDNNGQDPYWNELWDIVFAQAVCTNRERAVKKLDVHYQVLKEVDGYAGPKIDPAIFDMLWPLAQQSRVLINLHWSSVKRLACDLVKTWSLEREEIEARLPWAGNVVVS
jgi:hypothetical protein